jgi:hypothetical protein
MLAIVAAMSTIGADIVLPFAGRRPITVVAPFVGFVCGLTVRRVVRSSRAMPPRLVLLCLMRPLRLFRGLADGAVIAARAGRPIASSVPTIAFDLCASPAGVPDLPLPARSDGRSTCVGPAMLRTGPTVRRLACAGAELPAAALIDSGCSAAVFLDAHSLMHSLRRRHADTGEKHGRAEQQLPCRHPHFATSPAYMWTPLAVRHDPLAAASIE